ncbi:MAG TPA: hypothetical protein VN457_05720 [Chlamydiales bacterium]|nr:hypothetical protein [Chlamydiales bacterium]
MKKLLITLGCLATTSFALCQEPTSATPVPSQTPVITPADPSAPTSEKPAGEIAQTQTQESPFDAPSDKKSDEKDTVSQRDRYKIDTNMGNGTTILLKDGSVWKIAEVDRVKAARWLPGDNLSISKTGYTFPPYTLTNSVNRSRTLNIDTAGAEMVQGPTKKIKG